MKRRIMFVCHGNVCRSPMAEFIMKHMLKTEGLSDVVTVASSATSTEEIIMVSPGSGLAIGNPIYPPAAMELKRQKIPFEQRRAVQLKSSDYDKYDIFLGMDNANIRNMHRIFGGDPDSKVMRLMDLTERGGEVADPWYSDRFDIAYRDIYDGCSALMERIKHDIS